MDRPDAFDTRAVHAGAEPDELTGAVSPPIYQTSTYGQDGVGRPSGGYEYARSQNPTRDRFERAVAALEGGRHGIAFASGSAATAAIAQLAAAGQEVVVGDDVYGGTFRYLEQVHRVPARRSRQYADLAAGPDELWEQLTDARRGSSGSRRRRTRCSRSPTSRRSRRRSGSGPRSRAATRPLLVVDNTFASPALQRPLELGADIVFHSATKYLERALATRCSASR